MKIKYLFPLLMVFYFIYYISSRSNNSKNTQKSTSLQNINSFDKTENSIETKTLSLNDKISVQNSAIDHNRTNNNIFKVSKSQATMTLENIKKRFNKKHPNKQFKFKNGIDSQWEILRGDELSEYSQLDPKQAAHNFLSDHPELLSGVPEGVEFSVGNLQIHGQSLVVTIDANYDGLKYPGNKTLFFKLNKRNSKLTGPFTRMHDNTAQLNDINLCEKYSYNDALDKLREYHGEYKVLNPTKEKKAKQILATSGQTGKIGYSIDYQLLQNEGKRPYNAKINSCDNTFEQFPHSLAVH